MPYRPPVLLFSGFIAIALIAFASLANRPAVVAALGGEEQVSRLPVPLGLVMLAALLGTYASGIGLGWLLWGGRK